MNWTNFNIEEPDPGNGLNVKQPLPQQTAESTSVGFKPPKQLMYTPFEGIPESKYDLLNPDKKYNNSRIYDPKFIKEFQKSLDPAFKPNAKPTLGNMFKVSRDAFEKKQDTLVANNKKVDLYSGKNIKLKGDRFNNTNLNEATLKTLADSADKAGIEPINLLGVMARESTFGQEKLTSKMLAQQNQAKKTLSSMGVNISKISSFNNNTTTRDTDDLKGLFSAWNVDEDYFPKPVASILADFDVPGIEKRSFRGMTTYRVADFKKTNEFLTKNPKTASRIFKQMGVSKNIKDQNTIDLTAKYIKNKSLANYNSGDPDYVNKVQKDIDLLKQNKALTGNKSWLDKYK